MHRFPKSLLAALLVVALAPLFALPAVAAPGTWNVDAAHSGVSFEIRHFLTDVPGRFNDFDGTIVYDPENPANSSVEFTVQADSIDTANENRDNHLRSADFFNVEEFPTITFKSKKVVPAGGNLAVTGDFTLHGVTREITVPVEFRGTMGNVAGFSTEFTIDRNDYGIEWNRNAGGGAILGNDVDIEIEIEAKQPEPEEAEGE